MLKKYILTLSGPDRLGVVEAVTRHTLSRNGNVESSRMVRLDGDFAMLALISLPDNSASILLEDFHELTTEGFVIGLHSSRSNSEARFEGWQQFRISVSGGDHEGIIHQVANYLKERGINIEEMETDVIRAPMSGDPLFCMTARLIAPPELAGAPWQESLRELSEEGNLEVEIFPSSL
jgi:glycine cleavage system transcriptional repressor